MILYSITTTRIKTSNSCTDDVAVSRGVLQGDSISPLLFATFIDDLHRFLQDNSCDLVHIDHTNGISSLLYADDVVLLSNTPVDAKWKLRIYCEINRLEVNIQKSKIVIFKKSQGRTAKEVFYYGKERSEVVSSFTYLAILLSNSGLFHLNCKSMINKAKVASSAALNPLRLKSN